MHMYHSQLLQGSLEEVAAKNPTSIALIYKDTTLTYQELNKKANQLAHYLLEHGLAKNSIIGIYLGPCFEQIISILAILKIGAIYLPLDQSYPSERMKYMLQNSGAEFILTTKDLASNLKYEAKTISLDVIKQKLNSYSTVIPVIEVADDDLAYIIYTSGSTGKPKGVMIEHRSAYNTVSQMGNIFSLLPTDKVILNTSLAFDPSVWMIFWPLSIGASVVICELAKAPYELCQLITAHQVRLFHAGPTLFRLLLNQVTINSCHSLKLIIGGGEAWKVSDLKALREQLPHCELCNVYGPTEASIHATYWQSAGVNINELNQVPIGKPIGQMKAWLLDENDNEVSVGNIGELCLSGTGISTGYINQPELTMEKFIITDSCKYARLYKTGDLAKALPDGNLLFMGRTDDQIKLRGFRIELLEIENHMLNSGFVKNACVLIYRQNENDAIQKLVAFYVPKIADDLHATQKIQDFLKTVIPGYMLPCQYIVLKQLPITTNQKIDKEALRQLMSEQMALDKNTAETDIANQVALENSNLSLLTNLWREVLNLSEIKPEDHFFNMGGDSLNALDLIGKLNTHFKLNLSVISLFNHPTLESFYVHLSEQYQQKTGNELSQNVITTLKHQWPLSDNQAWLLRMAKKSLSINNIVMPYKIDSAINPILIGEAITILQKQQPLLCINIHRNETNNHYITLSPARNDIYNFVDLSPLTPSKQLDKLNSCETTLNNQLIQLASDSLLKINLFKCSETSFVMYIFMHHLISDPVSGVLVIQNLMDNYHCLLNKLVIDHRAQNITFMDYTNYEIEEKKRPQYLANLNEWRTRLSNKKWLIYFKNTDDVDMAAGFIRIPFPPTLADDLKGYARHKRITLFPLLLTILKQCLYELYSQKEFNIGINLSKRNDQKWAKMIGPLSEQAVSPIDFAKVASFDNLLSITLNNLSNILNSSITIEDLYKALFAQSQNQTELFNILFDYEKQNDENLFHGIKVSNLPVKPSAEVRRHLSIRISDKADNMYIQVRYRKNLFNKLDIKNITSHYFNIAKTIIKIQQKEKV